MKFEGDVWEEGCMDPLATFETLCPFYRLSALRVTIASRNTGFIFHFSVLFSMLITL